VTLGSHVYIMNGNAWNLPSKTLTKLFCLQNPMLHVILTIKDFFFIFLIVSAVYNTEGKECPELLHTLFHEVWQNEALIETDSLLEE